ncbi:MAG: 4-hydroxythreonine-4-phosphate dehydrogenase PdxA [Tenacibaculum sp.]
MCKLNKIIVGISIGDINGVGIEVILKTFEDKRMFDFCTPVIFASHKVISYHKKILNLNNNIQVISELKKTSPGKLNLINIWSEEPNFELGKPTETAGIYALKSLQAAVGALKEDQIQVLVTAPINKASVYSEKFNFRGHTEYLESQLKGQSLMILMTENLRIGLITGHIPLSEVAKNISCELIKTKVETMYLCLVQDFNINKPKIAVLGLNPHCGDNGLIGKEDIQIIRPAIKEIQQSGKLVYGPYAADGFFGSKTYEQFDGVLAMYHDQGLAPFKALSFGKGVNFTAGLDKIRTSPDHGTGFDIAGKNIAQFFSFKEALFNSLNIYKNRLEYQNLTKTN